jgi:hypothetical protein
MRAGPSTKKTFSATQSGRRGQIMVSHQDIEFARLRMLEVRKALEDYETLTGVASPCEYSWQIQVFSDATGTYLKLSANQ